MQRLLFINNSASTVTVYDYLRTKQVSAIELFSVTKHLASSLMELEYEGLYPILTELNVFVLEDSKVCTCTDEKDLLFLAIV